MDLSILGTPDLIAPNHRLFAVRKGNWKYIHVQGAVGADELYELNATSSYETVNLIGSQPAIADSLWQALVAHYPMMPTRDLYLPALYKPR